MSIDVDTVRTAIGNRLRQISGLRVQDVADGQINPPQAVVWVNAPIEFDEAMQRGLDKYQFSVTLLVARASERNAQQKLDPYLNGSGSSSIKAAVEATSGSFGRATLGGAVQSCRVTRVSEYGVVGIGGVEYLMAEFEIETHG